MADEREYFGIYTAESDGYPVIVLDNHDKAQQYNKANMLGVNSVVMPCENLGRNKAAVKMLDVNAPPTQADMPEPDPDAQLKAEIRTELEEKERRERLEAEVKKEMAANNKQPAKLNS